MECVGHVINIGKINYNIFLGRWPAGHPPKKEKILGEGAKGRGPLPPPPSPHPNPHIGRGDPLGRPKFSKPGKSGRRPQLPRLNYRGWEGGLGGGQGPSAPGPHPKKTHLTPGRSVCQIPPPAGRARW